MTATDITKHSVTKDDLPANGAAFRFNLWSFLGVDSPLKALPDLPPYWSFQRDSVLRNTILHESHWAGAVGITISRASSLAWEIQSGSDLRKRRIQEMLHNSNSGKGWVNFISQHLRDYLLADNGAHVEVVRSSSAVGSKVLGIVHLDSRRCQRTGDPERPIVYRSLNGTEHELRWYQTFEITDMPESGDSYYGVGLCAASRAYNVIRRLAAMEQFVFEKLSGKRPLSLHFLSGLTNTQLRQMMLDHAANNAEQGFAVYGGAAITAFMQKENISHVEIPIAATPENFNRKEEFSAALLSYANFLGLDPQDLQPLGGQALGVGAQSEVLDNKARGKGQASWRQDFTHKLNQFVLADSELFVFLERDYKDEKQQVDINTAKVGIASQLVEKVGITPAMATQYLVDEDVLPQIYLQQPDVTSVGTISDTDKPESEMPEELPAGQQITTPPPVAPAPANNGGQTNGI